MPAASGATAGACSCGDRRASTSTRCASTRRASRCAASTGRRPPGAGSSWSRSSRTRPATPSPWCSTAIPAGCGGTPPDSSFDAAVRAAGSVLRALRLPRAPRRRSSRPGAARTSSRQLARRRLHRRARRARDGRARRAPRRSGRWLRGGRRPRSTSSELVLVTANLDAGRDRGDSRVSRGAVSSSVVWIDAPSFAGRPTRAATGPLRLAAAGIPVAAVRNGDDLAAALDAALAGAGGAWLGRSPPACSPRSRSRSRGCGSRSPWSRGRARRRRARPRCRRSCHGGGHAGSRRQPPRSPSAWIAFGAKAWELLPVAGRARARAARGGRRPRARRLLPRAAAVRPRGQPGDARAHARRRLRLRARRRRSSSAAERPVAAAAVTVVGAGWPATLLGVGRGPDRCARARRRALDPARPAGPHRRGRCSRAPSRPRSSSSAPRGRRPRPTIARRGRARLGELGSLRRQPEGDGRRVRVERELRGHRLPAPRRPWCWTIEGPGARPYWRTSTLDMFSDDHWFENHFWLARGGWRHRPDAGRTRSTPRAARIRREPDRAAGRGARARRRPARRGRDADAHRRAAARHDLPALGRRRLRASAPLGDGRRYKVWSYAPDPAPAALARSRPHYPSPALAVSRAGWQGVPRVRQAGSRRGRRAHAATTRSYRDFRPYSRVYAAARRVAGDARTPYAAVLALESWFRQRGGFRYDEQPPQAGARRSSTS